MKNQETIKNGNKTVYITKRVSPWGAEQYFINAYTQFGGGGKSTHTYFPTEQEAMTFAENYINE